MTVKVAIGGSLRFFKEMKELSKKLSENNIEHYMPDPSIRDPKDLSGYSKEFQDLTFDEKVKGMSGLVFRFFEKIDRSDLLYLVNPNEYIGFNATADMVHAYYNGKDVYAWSEVNSFCLNLFMVQL